MAGQLWYLDNKIASMTHRLMASKYSGTQESVDPGLYKNNTELSLLDPPVALKMLPESRIMN